MKPALVGKSVVTSPVSTPVLPVSAVVVALVVVGLADVPGTVVLVVDVVDSSEDVDEPSAESAPGSTTRGPHADTPAAIPSTIANDVSRCNAPQNGHRRSLD